MEPMGAVVVKIELRRTKAKESSAFMYVILEYGPPSFRGGGTMEWTTFDIVQTHVYHYQE